MRKLIWILPALVLFTGCSLMEGFLAGLEGSGGTDSATGEAIGGSVDAVLTAVSGGAWESIKIPALGAVGWLAGKFGWFGKTGKVAKAAVKKVAGPKDAAAPKT